MYYVGCIHERTFNRIYFIHVYFIHVKHKKYCINGHLYSAFMKWRGFIEDSQSDLCGECINETTTEEDGGYYNTTQLKTIIRVVDLQQVIQEKSKGENNVFQFEYKVLIWILNYPINGLFKAKFWKLIQLFALSISLQMNTKRKRIFFARFSTLQFNAL